MAYSWTDLVASAGQQNFAFSIPYLSRDHISVYINGELTEDWTFLSSQTVRLDSGAALNDTVRIRRITPIDEPVVDYNDGSVLGEAQLDATALQSLYTSQEVADNATNSFAADEQLRWDAQGRIITNVGTPVGDTDVTTKAYVDLVSGAASAAAAAVSAASALSSKNASEAAQATAEAAQAAAELAETNAEAAQAIAEAAAAGVAGAANATKGVVRMYRTGTGTWAVYDADQTAIDISASTTDGLQEAIDAACNNGWDLEVSGGGIKPGGSPTDVAVIQCTTGIVFPPMQNKTIRIGACTVNFSPAVTAEGVTFDSCMMVDVDWHGQIVYQGNSAAVLVKPVSNVPYDLVTVCADSKFKINHIALTGGTNPVCISFNATNGAITGTRFESFEINGINQAGSVGIRLTSPTNGILGNVFAFNRIHLCKAAAIQIGTSTTGASSIYGNHFEGHIFGASGGATVGIDVYGVNNSFIGSILSNEGALTTGVTFESSANSNRFTISKNDGSTTVSGNTTLNNFVNGECTFTWTPAMTFATPGNLSVAYTNQVGFGIRQGSEVTLFFRIDTSTWTHTSASGNLRMTGLPFNSLSTSLYHATGALRWTNLTVTGTLVAMIDNNSSIIEFAASASGGVGGKLTITGAPTGTNYEIIGSITYRIA